MAGAAPTGSVQQIGHHSSASGSFAGEEAGGFSCVAAALLLCEEAAPAPPAPAMPAPTGTAAAGTAELSGAELLTAFFLQSGCRQGRHQSSPRRPPHQWPQSWCLLPHARRSFSAQESEGGNLLSSVPSSLPQQGDAKLSERRIFAIHGCEHQRQEPTGQACSDTCWCFCQPSQDQPQW